MESEAIPKRSDSPASDTGQKVGINISPIRFGIDAEIDKALNLYCRDESRLSNIYWPKAFRALATSILVFMLDKPEIWAELSTQTFEVNHDQLQRLIDALKDSISNYIKVKHRQWIFHLLKEMSCLRKKFGLGNRLPKMYGESSDWPIDLEDKDDLLTSLTVMSLREDVHKYLWKILDEVIPPEKYLSLDYFGAIRSSNKRYPIVVEVTEEYVDIVQERIATVSNNLRSQNFDNLLPIDLVEVKRIPDREVVRP